MYFTNNERTIYNLTLYSYMIYNERYSCNYVFNRNWKYTSYFNIPPYGNINKKIVEDYTRSIDKFYK